MPEIYHAKDKDAAQKACNDLNDVIDKFNRGDKSVSADQLKVLKEVFDDCWEKSLYIQ